MKKERVHKKIKVEKRVKMFKKVNCVKKRGGREEGKEKKKCLLAKGSKRKCLNIKEGKCLIHKGVLWRRCEKWKRWGYKGQKMTLKIVLRETSSYFVKIEGKSKSRIRGCGKREDAGTWDRLAGSNDDNLDVVNKEHDKTKITTTIIHPRAQDRITIFETTWRPGMML
jgi:hypothetical protein